MKSHDLFDQHFCRVRRTNEKGVVEGGVKFVRLNFFVPVPQLRDFAELNANMDKLKPRFLDQGVPVIVGEYGATTKKDPESVRLYLLSVAEKVYRMGMCPMLWDPGSHFDRRKLEFNDPELVKGFQRILGMKRDLGGDGK